MVTGDGFDGLRSLLKPAEKRKSTHQRRSYGSFSRSQHFNGAAPGRWSLFRPEVDGPEGRNDPVEGCARQLLSRYGVVFHRLLLREEGLPPWRDLLRALRRLEARGEVRGGRFVAGFSGEQYALAEAVQHVRAARQSAPSGELVAFSAADPLNLVGITSPGERVPAIATNRVAYRDGVPEAARVGKEIISLLPSQPVPSPEVRQALAK